jgi:NitT/TauT family transport system substrate-binding protein
VLPYGDLLPDLYGNALVTSKETAARKPELVKRFSAALLKGLTHSVEHPDEVGQVLRKYQPTQDAGVASAEVALMAPYVRPAGFDGPVGELTDERVEKVLGTLREAGAIPDGVRAADVATAGLAPKR